jgi:phosphatidate cytidylyltransferase
MLRQRVITAIVLVAILFGALAWSPIAFTVVAAILAAAAMFEWLRLAGYRDRPAAAVGALFGGALLALQSLAPESLRVALGLVGVAAVLGWFGVGGLLVVAQRRGAAAVHIARLPLVSMALLFLGGLWGGLVELLRGGPVWLVSALAIVWAADIAAYFAGRAFGRRKLAPNISPGKTWAGVVGAIGAVLLLAFALRAAWPGGRLLSSAIIDGAGAAIGAALLVLLVESLLKRQAGVKDSSRLLPGHGGVLDRIDALLPVLPLVLLILRWLAR